MDIGHWTLGCLPQEESFGFIYIIRNNLNGKQYIGKKQMLSKVTKPPLKGNKNKRRSTKESDWKSYIGSCNDLIKDIDEYGKKNFSFTIIKFCRNKWELSYHETLTQLQAGVLLRENDGKFYNGIVHCRIGKEPKNS